MEHNVALVDDHHLMRSGLAGIVDNLDGYRVVLEAGNGRELIDQLARITPGSDRMPTIAIVDLNMPVMDGFATIAWLHDHAPGILPLVLTFNTTDDAMVRAVRAGARGVVLKNMRPSVLKTALDSLVLTGYYYTEQTIHMQMDRREQMGHEQRERNAIRERITPREMEFLHLVCDEAEYTYEQIAERMGVHRRTVDNFRMGLFAKCNVRSKTGLVLFAIRWGILSDQGDR